jgi:hypothetical protein
MGAWNPSHATWVIISSINSVCLAVLFLGYLGLGLQLYLRTVNAPSSLSFDASPKGLKLGKPLRPRHHPQQDFHQSQQTVEDPRALAVAMQLGPSSSTAGTSSCRQGLAPVVCRSGLGCRRPASF